MRIALALFLFSGAIAVASNDSRHVGGQMVRSAHAEETPADSLAAQLRRQGHRCEEPVNVQRDAERSRPDELVWIIKCTNATYRMRLVPNMAAKVEQI
jgi:hypothetical protein